MKSTIEKLTKWFLDNFWIKYNEISIIEQDNEKFLIKIKSDESWLLIWPNWRNIDSISHILKLIIKGNIPEKIKIYLEINDYKKNRDDRLQDFIISKIKQVESSWEKIILPYYSAYDRKKIHWYVQAYNNESIITKSYWEWTQRRLEICKAQKKLTIDIDWNDI